MVKTLYDKLSAYDRGFKSILNEYELALENLSGNSKRLDVTELKSEYDKIRFEISGIISNMYPRIMKFYEKNQVFNDAINKKISVYDSLEELSKVNKGIRKILPRKRNYAHNKRLDDLSKLVKEPHSLKCGGIFYPDNFITNSAYGIFFGYLAAKGYIHLNHAAVTLDAQNARGAKIIYDAAPMLVSSFTGMLSGIYGNSSRFQSLTEIKMQAEFIDKKINQFY